MWVVCQQSKKTGKLLVMCELCVLCGLNFFYFFYFKTMLPGGRTTRCRSRPNAQKWDFDLQAAVKQKCKFLRVLSMCVCV